MATLFGGTHARANSPAVPLPNLTLSIQTSVQGRARPLVWGTAMLAGNLIDLLDFTPSLVIEGSPSPASVGGKGAVFRSPQSTQPTYQWTYYATVVTSLCEGPITSVNAFTGDGLTMSTYGGGTGGGTVFLGTQTQNAFGPVATKHPDHALTYRGEAYIAWSPMYLGTNPTVPNFTFEITGGINSAGSDFPLDANPRDVVADFMSNPQYGIPGFPSTLVAGMSLYAAWCQANGLVVSVALTDQVEAASFISQIAQATYSEPVWSNGVFDMVPYGEFVLTGHGATYTPDTTPDYDLVLDDFLPLQGGAGDVGGGDALVSIDRADPQTLINNLRIEYLNRASIYVATEIDEKDEASIAATRERPSDVRDMHLFKLGSAAATSAAYQLRRARVGTTYYFTLPKHFVLIDLMDLVQLPLDALGLSDEPQIVRIKEIQENADRSFTFTAEEFDGATLPPLYLRQASTHSVPDFNADPGAINPPILFEMPASADPTASTAMIYAAVSGGANYGGSDVYTSTDSVNYVLSAKIKGNARMGVTTTPLPSTGAPGNDIVDIADILGVDLTQSQGQLGNGGLSDMLNRATLCYVDGELIAYELAMLTAANQYNLTPLLRGAYGSPILVHAAGVPFARVDGNIAHIPYEKARAGTAIYIKFVPFNRYGGGQETLASATAYVYRLAGTALQPEDTATSSLDDAAISDFIGVVNQRAATINASNGAAVARAGVTQTQETITNLNQAIASVTTTVYAQLGIAQAGIVENATAIATTNGAVASLSSSVTAQFGTTNSNVTTNATAIANATGTYATLQQRLDANDIVVSSNNTAISDAAGSYGSLVSRISTGEGNTAAAQSTATSALSLASTVNGDITGRYALDIDINGKISGFSVIAGTGISSSFDVRVDKFNLWASGYSNTPVFSISTIGGVAGITVNGNYLGDLSALNNAIGNNAITHGATSTGGSGGISGTASLTVRAGDIVTLWAYVPGPSNVAGGNINGINGATGKLALTYSGPGISSTTITQPLPFYYDGATYIHASGYIPVTFTVGSAGAVPFAAAAYYNQAGTGVQVSLAQPCTVTGEARSK